MNVFLYITTAIIWGTTWIALHWQLGDIPILLSIFYRFALAGVLFLPVLVLLGKLQNTTLKDQFFFILQSVCLFSFNFICFYKANQYIVSGLVSVIFSLAIIFNMFNQWLIWRKRPTVSIYVSAALGIIGLVLLFWQQLTVIPKWQDVIYGAIYGISGTYLFSLGNMISIRNSHHNIQPWTSNAYGMLYGAIILFLLIQILGIPWAWDPRPIYLGSLLYLVIAGSMIGFTTCLALVVRIGANQAAYVTLLFPVIALTFSTFIEDYDWSITTIVGLLLVLVGVFIAIKGDKLLKMVNQICINVKSVVSLSHQYISKR